MIWNKYFLEVQTLYFESLIAPSDQSIARSIIAVAFH